VRSQRPDRPEYSAAFTFANELFVDEARHMSNGLPSGSQQAMQQGNDAAAA
jgi:hypothetical protein